MLNPFKEVNWNPDTAARRTFAKSLVIGFPCLAVVLLQVGYFTGNGWNLRLALKLGGFGAGFGVLFYALPVIARPFYVVWYALACCIGFVVGNVVFALIFYVLVTGLGLVKQCFGSQAICKTPDLLTKTYWLDAPTVSDPKRYFSQY